MKYSMNRARHKRGNPKLHSTEVRDIRKFYAERSWPTIASAAREIGLRWHVHPATVADVLTRRSWASLETES